MNSKNSEDELKKKVEQTINKIEKAKKEEKSALAQTIYLGTLGIIFILPVILGAYLGVWLDSQLKGFSFSWTISLIIIGVFIGALNIYLFIKE